jgi:hypothetical protein
MHSPLSLERGEEGVVCDESNIKIGPQAYQYRLSYILNFKRISINDVNKECNFLEKTDTGTS